jgi:hypothetical protein
VLFDTSGALEFIERMNKKNKEFTKADLKDGMVGITREGERYIFLCGKFRNSDGNSYWGTDDDLEDDLTSINGYRDLDFMKICTSSSNTLGNWCKDEYLTTIWERNETTEMTIDEIKEKLGIKGTLKIVEG